MKQSWDVKKVGDVCKTGAGGTPLKSNKEYYSGGTIPWLQSGEVSQGEIFESKNYITEKGLINSSARLFPIDTVLVAMYGATAGQVGVLKFEACTNQAVCGILPNEKVISKFIYYCFLSKKDELIAQAVGNAQPNISQIKIRETKIPIPPLPEQHRIISILDEAFSAIAKAKANAEQNLKNAREVFESYLQGVFENKGMQWEMKKLGDDCELIMGQSPSGESYNTNGTGVPLINGPVEFGKEPFSKTIRSKFTTEPTKFCKENDLILCVRGSTTGRINIAGFDACIGRGVAAIRYTKNQFWLNYFILSSRKKIYDLGTGATFPNVSTEILKNLQLPIPTLSEQQYLVQELDLMSLEIKKLEVVYQNKTSALEELKKSLLQKAFAGELNATKVLA